VDREGRKRESSFLEKGSEEGLMMILFLNLLLIIMKPFPAGLAIS
jgi:hypothetical protein